MRLELAAQNVGKGSRCLFCHWLPRVMTGAEFAAVIVGNCQDLVVRILVTNDDGIDSPGLHHLARQLMTVGEVTVLAPSSQYSGAGTAIGHLGEPLPDVHRVRLPELLGLGAAYHFDGPPALAALLACKQLFGATPDLLVSGINEGWNVGQTVHFSGTVGAASAANVLGVTGISISQKGGHPQFWESAAAVAVDVINDLPPETALLNVNVPNLAYDDLKGFAATTLSRRSPYTMERAYLRQKTDAVFGADFERGGRYDNYEGSDAHAVEQGLVSITRLSTLQAIAGTI